MATISERVSHLLVRRHRLLLVLAILISAMGLPLSQRLSLDWDVEAMFPPGHPLVSSYRHLQERFGGNQIVLVVYRDPELWANDGSGLDRLAEVTKRVAAVEGVQAVLSLSELDRVLRVLRGPANLLDFSKSNKPALLDPDDKLAQAFARVFEGYTHRPGSQHVAIACMLEDESLAQAAGRKRDDTIAALRSEVESLPGGASDAIVTGEPVLVADGFEMVRRDGVRLGITSTLLVVLVLLLCFRSIRWTLIPLAVVQFALIATQALLVVLGVELTMISSTLGAVVTVIGVATTTHVLLQFQSIRRKGVGREEAIQKTMQALLPAVFWACVTDAVGFASLTIAGVGPVRDFGLMMCVGSLMVLIAIVMLVPGLALFGKWANDPSTPRIDLAIRLTLRRLMETVVKHRSVGRWVLVVLLVVGVVGSIRMRLETDFTKNFDPNSQIVRGYSVIETELGGAGVWDIMLPAPRTFSQAYVDSVVAFEERLRAIEIPMAGHSARQPEESENQPLRLTKVLSVIDAERAACEVRLLAALPVSARLRGMQSAMPEFSGALLRMSAAGDDNWIRIMLRSKEQAPAEEKEALVAAVRAALENHTETPEWRELFTDTENPLSLREPEIAGYHVMLGELVASVIEDQWKCFLLAFIGVYGVVAVATRSWLLAAYSMVPNTLPILLVIGSMGWLEFKMNMGAAMIAAVSLGLSVDSSIHYLMHYQRCRQSGTTAAKALRSAQENVGLAVVLATAALVAGFLSLARSEFVPTVVFGTLASLTMLGGLIGNLVVLPILVAKTPKKT